MKLSLSNLNWDNATVLNFNYIYYLALMLNERTNDVGLLIKHDAGETFDISNYEPGGLFRFQQLYDIYNWTMLIGQYYYFNSANLSNDSFKNGHRVKHFGYTIDQLSQIASFDFTKKPLIPNQRLNYYDQFLKPLYLVLKEYKKIWVNMFYAKDEVKLYHGYNDSNNDYVEKYHIQQHVTGQDRLDYYSLSHAISSQIEFVPSGIERYSPGGTTYRSYRSTEHDVTYLGGIMNSDYQMFYSFGYMKTKWVDPPSPPGPPAAGWSFDSGYASVVRDERDGMTPEDGDIATVNHWHWTASDAYGGIVHWVFDHADEHYYTWDSGSWHEDLTPIIVDNGGADISEDVGYAGFSVMPPADPTANIGAGSITITFQGHTSTGTYSGPTPSDGTTFSHQESGAHVTIIYHRSDDDEGGGSPPASGEWVNDGYENDYADNYEGLKFNYYSVIPSTQIQCPIPLISGCNYELYMYSFTYPILDITNENVHKKIRTYFYPPEGEYIADTIPTTFAWYDLYSRKTPTFQLQPFGNYFQVETGTLQYTFNCFDIALPSALPYTESVFNDLPVKMMGNVGDFRQVAYSPYNYDTTIWRAYGDTPTRDYHDEYNLRPGKYLEYIGPSAVLYSENRECCVEWWYRPLLIVDYSSLFSYN